MGFWNQRTFCLITGASRGIGKCIAVEFAKKVGGGSVLLLVARSAGGLEETKAEIVSGGNGGDVKVVTAAIDLGSTESSDYLHMLNSALITTGSTASDFDLSLLVHNAGSLGNIRLKLIEIDSLAELRSYYEFNLFSMILLTTQFFKVFSDPGKERTVVQISSLGAIEPFKTWGCYCAGKAARDMAMRSIAAEDPSIATLNYAPGPVETDIYEQAMETGDPEVAAQFKEGKKSGTVLSPIQTITKLIKILGEQKYRKGEHVDYYDIPD